ncbi:hypothetical protein HIM_09207 [Hirsutella minnesotensis 3608]|uniref:Uncharacterized protein n=1 Tax=Hirsutella minnesotensis 3608 TaxID=1043627 RepID=A0A0F8A391_9HYPO|nr:hypothetical protein HIM_09207 [Hirsutella minnesotensis 3608]
MAPLTCRVIDAHRKGIPDVHVILDCRDQFHRSVSKFESLTDQDGSIIIWFPIPTSGHMGTIEPQAVDTTTNPRVSLHFFPEGSLAAPWVALHTDLYLRSNQWHGVVLALQPAPRFEYSPYPVANPQDLLALGLCGEVGGQDRSQPLSTPSPLVLPSPVETTGERSFQAPPPPFDGEGVPVPGQKRMMDSEITGQVMISKKTKR